jgi:iron complex outermembrane recepter protein
MRALSTRSLLLSSSMLAAVAVATPASAQQATGLEEIIVTAQKRVERLQETPVSVSAITSEMLEQRGIVDARDLTTIAPNITTQYSPSSINTLGIFIRGVGDGEPILTVDAPIGLYVDGVPLGRTTGAIFDMVDLERVEVLRGQQGTLYGRNTVGGAVNFITAKPGDKFGFEQKFGYGNFAAFQSRTRLDTGEFAPGLKAKFAFVHKRRHGYTDNLLQPDRSQDPGADRVNAFRGIVSFDEGGGVRASYSYEASVEKAHAMAFQLTALRPDVQAYLNASPFLGGTTLLFSPDRRLKQIRLDDDGEISTRLQGHTLTLEGDVGAATIKSLTGFRRWDDINTGTDLDGNGGLRGFTLNPVTFAPEPIGKVQLFNARNNRHQHQFSEEINVVGTAFEKLEYVIGGFYFHEKSRELNPQGFTFLVPSPGGIPLGPGLTVPAFGLNLASPLIYTHYSTSKAVFGQGAYHVTDQIDVTAGIRYTHDNRHLRQTSPIPRDVRAAFSKTNWMASANYKYTPDVMVFVRVATGYRSGGFNARSSGNTAFTPESATTYEAGIKSELFDRTLRVNFGAYYTRAKDLQVQQFQAGSGGATSVTVNAGKSRVQGIELDVRALLGMGFSVDGNFGIADRKYLQYLLRDAATNAIIDIASLVKGGGSAKYTGNLGIQYDTDVGNSFATLTARVDYSYRSKVRWHPSTYQAVYNELIAAPGHGLFDARLTLSGIKVSGAETSISGWIKNIGNREYKQWGIDFGGLGFAGNNWNVPRTFGVEVSAKF